MSRWWLATSLLILLANVAACGWLTVKRPQDLPAEIALLEDRNGTLTIEQAASPEMAGRYLVETGHRMSMGFNRSPLWVRLSLRRTPAEAAWVLDVAAPWMDLVELYLPRSGGGWSKRVLGLEHPTDTSMVGGFAFRISAETPGSGYAYLRLKSVLSLNAGIALLPEVLYNRQTVIDGYVYGALFGVMTAMILVNLMVLLTTGDRTYLLYAVYLASIIAHQVCLQGQILLAPGSLWPLVPEISLIVSSFALFFGAAFCRMFLNIRIFAPLLDRVLMFMQGAAAALFLLAVSGQIWWGTWVTHIMALVGPLLAIVAGVKALSVGYRPARFYLFAWTVLLLGAMAWGAWSMGVELLVPLPRSSLTFAAALESVLLSLALADRIRSIQRERKILALSERRYRQMSLTDDLTGLSNSRYFWGALDREVDRAHASALPLGLILLDVDDFKQFNDTFGHTEGDKVLAELGKCLARAVRPSDAACRYGGEEFALLLPGAGADTARMVAERIRVEFEQRQFHPSDGLKVTVTVSLGAAQLRSGDDSKSLVRRADKALYRAKSQGKNQTICDGEAEAAA